MIYPYKDKFKVSQAYKGASHQGIDLVGLVSKNIYSIASGTVEIASNADPKGFGTYVRVKLDNGCRDYYGHLSKVNVKVGQKIKTGDLIGVEGSTGHSTGSHLHLERRASISHDSDMDISKITGIPNKKCVVEVKKEAASPAPADTAIVVGNKVSILSGAIYGGESNTRGKKVPSEYIGKYTDTVTKIATHKGVKEALLKELYSWVAVSKLKKVK